MSATVGYISRWSGCVPSMVLALVPSDRSEDTCEKVIILIKHSLTIEWASETTRFWRLERPHGISLSVVEILKFIYFCGVRWGPCYLSSEKRTHSL
jgi:hypothetical protein